MHSQDCQWKDGMRGTAPCLVFHQDIIARHPWEVSQNGSERKCIELPENLYAWGTELHLGSISGDDSSEHIL